jgi:hypothetical protein
MITRSWAISPAAGDGGEGFDDRRSLAADPRPALKELAGFHTRAWEGIELT